MTQEPYGDNLDPKKRKNSSLRWTHYVILLLIGTVIGLAVGYLTGEDSSVGLPPTPLLTSTPAAQSLMNPTPTAQASSSESLKGAEIITDSATFTVTRWQNTDAKWQQYQMDGDNIVLTNETAYAFDVPLSYFRYAPLYDRYYGIVTEGDRTTTFVISQGQSARFENSIVAVSDDQTTTATGWQNMIDIVDNNTRTQRFTFPTLPTEKLLFSPNNQVLAAAFGTRIELYDLNQAGKTIFSTDATQPIIDMAFLADGSIALLAAAEVRILTIDAGVRSYPFAAIDTLPTDVAVSADGKWMSVTVGDDVIVWRLDDGAPLAPDENTATPRVFHADVTDALASGFVDSNRLIVVYASGALRLFNVTSGAVIEQLS